MNWIYVGGAVATVMFLGAGAMGFCSWCKKWTEGEIGWFDDVEHGADGKPLTGWRLVFSRVMEGFIGTPLCYPLNKALGRMKKPLTFGWPFGSDPPKK